MNWFKIIYILIAVFSLFKIITRSFSTKIQKEAFYYFTNQVTLISVIVLLLNIENDILYFSIALYMTIISLTFNFLLLPYGKKQNITLCDISLTKFDNLLIHIILPIMFFMNWFFTKNNIYYLDIVYSIVYPAIYILFVIIRGKLGKEIDAPTNYIYPFFDIDKFGIAKVMVMVLSLFIFSVLIGISLIYLKLYIF